MGNLLLSLLLFNIIYLFLNGNILFDEHLILYFQMYHNQAFLLNPIINLIDNHIQ